MSIQNEIGKETKSQKNQEPKSLTKVKGVKVGTREGKERLKDDQPEVRPVRLKNRLTE
jgi:hypothetical protein